VRLGARRERRRRSEFVQGILKDPYKAGELAASLFLGRALLSLAGNSLALGSVDRLVGVEDLFLGLVHVTRGF